jgi:hypothetical protein
MHLPCALILVLIYPSAHFRSNDQLIKESKRNRQWRNVSFDLYLSLTCSALYDPNGPMSIIAFVVLLAVAIALWYREFFMIALAEDTKLKDRLLQSRKAPSQIHETSQHRLYIHGFRLYRSVQSSKRDLGLVMVV